MSPEYIAADAARSDERIARAENFWQQDPTEAWFDEVELRKRHQALVEDGEAFGLVPHEQAELDRLAAFIDRLDKEKNNG